MAFNCKLGIVGSVPIHTVHLDHPDVDRSQLIFVTEVLFFENLLLHQSRHSSVCKHHTAMTLEACVETPQGYSIQNTTLLRRAQFNRR